MIERFASVMGMRLPVAAITLIFSRHESPLQPGGDQRLWSVGRDAGEHLQAMLGHVLPGSTPHAARQN